MRNQVGYTLAELLIASMLGLLLSASILSALYASMQSYNLKQAHEQIQENSALAMHFLKQDIQTIGFSGCLRGGLQKVNVSSKGLVAELLTSNGYIKANQHKFKHSDSISFVALAGSAEDVISNMTYVHSDIDLTDGSGIAKGQEVLITDCLQGDIFQVSRVWNNRLSHSSDVNSHGNLSTPYSRGSIVYPLNVVEYKIAMGVGGKPGLYRKAGGSRFQELVPNVMELTVSYSFRNIETGVITNQRALVNIDEQKLIGVDIELWLTSENEVLPFPMKPTNSARWDRIADDRYLYKKYQLSVSLLNNG